MRGRRPTPWIRWRTILLVVVILLPGTPELLSRIYAENAVRDRAAAALAPGRNTLPERKERNQVAPPDPSGAYPPYPLNHTFDAGIVNLGNPTNHDFETPASVIGTPATNYNFASGTFTGWTTGGGPLGPPTIVATGGPDGPYAQLKADAHMTSSAFTVDEDTQYGSVNIFGLSIHADQVVVDVLYGAGFTQSERVIGGATPSDTSWSIRRFRLAEWTGDEIKLKISRNGSGIAGVDDVGLQRIDVPAWVPQNDAVYVAGSPSGNAVRTNADLTSLAFTLPANAQQLSLRYRTSDTSGTGVQIDLLRGGTFSTVTSISGGYLGGSSGVWRTFVAPIGDYAGEEVKLRVRPQLQPIFVDDIGILQHALPGWTIKTGTENGAVVPGVDADGTYVKPTGRSLVMNSSPIDVGMVDPPGRLDGRSYVVRAAVGQSSGAILRVWWITPTHTWAMVTNNSSTPSGPKNFRFSIGEEHGTHGYLQVQLTGGNRIYSIGDNVARQQRSEPFSQQTGAGVDTSTGAFATNETDLTIEGGPLPLSFIRYYHGHSDRLSTLGFRWSHTFDTFLGIYGNDVAVIHGSGKEEFFRWDSIAGNHKALDVRVKSTLTKYTSPPDGVDYRYVTKDKLTYNFEGDGDLISIVDPNGNTITLYRDPTSELVTSIEDPAGRSFDLTYDANGRLETVTGPDAAEVTYTYDVNGDLVAVDKPEDGLTEYVYDRHRLVQVRERQGDDLASARMVTTLTNTLDDVNRVIAQSNEDVPSLWPRVIEAESFSANTPRSGDAWELQSDLAGYAGTGFMRPVPANGNNIATNYATTSPQLDYLVDFPATGTYYVWIRGYADDGTSDSVHVGLDGKGVDTGTAVVFDQDVWDWSQWTAAGPRATIDVTTAGTHTVNIWMREDGFRFDRFLITPDENYEPTAIGPAETVVEAESFVAHTPRDSRAWELNDDLAGYGGTGFVRAEPTGGSAIGTNYATTSPQLDYQVHFPAAGTYYVWVRGWADDGASDSAHLGIDGMEVESARWLYFDQDEWYWSPWTVAGPRITLDVRSPGVHTINLWMREPGLRIDRLLFTPDEEYTPTGIGPASTPLPASTIDVAYLTGTKQGVTRFSDPLRQDTEFFFDEFARTFYVDFPGNDVSVFIYDSVGNLQKTIDAAEHETQFAYDANANPNSMTDPLGNPSNITYNALSLPLTFTDPNNNDWIFTYDVKGNVLTETDPLSRVHSYEYDLAAQLEVETDARDVETRYLYDLAGRLTNVQDAAEDDLITYSYDAVNRQTGMTDETGSTGWNYDAASRVTSVTTAGGTIAYTYDAASRRETMTLPGSKTLTYDYDAAGQLASITDWQSRTTTYEYTGFGALDRVDRPNDVFTEYEYDGGGRLSAVEHNTVSTMHARYAYDVDPNGNRFAVHITGTGVTNGTENYEYDELDRLVEVTYPSGGGTVEYDYDVNGNRTEVTSGGVTTYSYDDADQLLSLSGANTVAYTYDDNGNRLTANTDSYTYDWRNRLTSVTVGGSTVTYTYAGDDLRTARTIAGVTTTSLWDREQGLPEVVDDGTVVTVQTGDGVQTSIDRATNTATYPLLDGLGSLRAQTDGSGAVTSTADWDVFGNLRASSGTQGSFGFTGEQKDPTSGLTYLRARDADPLTGRFLQQDTVQPGAPGTQGYNRYAYAANNPVTYTDPSGHNVADLVGDAALLGAFYYAMRVLSKVPKHLNKLPPIARKLVTALLGLGMFLIRQLLVIVMLKVIMDASVVFDFMIGRSMGLLSWVRMFKPVKWFMDSCTKPLAGASGCKLAGKLIPKLPKCFVKGVGEEAVELGLDATLGALGLGGGTSFGKTDAAFFAGGALLNCVGADGKREFAYCAANSFDGSTEVLLGDGTRKRIDQIEVGEMVWSSDPDTGEVGPRNVSAVIVGEGSKQLVDLTVQINDSKSSITATDGHPFRVASPAKWLVAAALAIGMTLTTADGDSAIVTARRQYVDRSRVYNLTVDDFHTFFVSDKMCLYTIAHNMTCIIQYLKTF